MATAKLREKLVDHLTYGKFLAAHRRASKSKGLRKEVLKFNQNKVSNLFNIMDIVGEGRYLPSKYRQFMIYDPKERLILALPYHDRVVHQWYIEEFIKPYYLPRFIADSYACIPERGTHKAVNKIQSYMRKMRDKYGDYYILKMDISKFFYEINPNILYNILSDVIADPELLALTHTIIFEDGEHDGLPIGNYVSQYFANIYLNELDQFCKRTLKIKYYVRYMDDFIALAPNKATAKRWFAEIEQFVKERLDLKLNHKSRYFPNRRGLSFLGFRVYEDFRLISKRSKNSIKEIVHDYETNAINREEFAIRATAWYAHVRHANSHNYVNKALKKYQAILPIVFPDQKAAPDLRKATNAGQH